MRFLLKVAAGMIIPALIGGVLLGLFGLWLLRIGITQEVAQSFDATLRMTLLVWFIMPMLGIIIGMLVECEYRTKKFQAALMNIIRKKAKKNG